MVFETMDEGGRGGNRGNEGIGQEPRAERSPPWSSEEDAVDLVLVLNSFFSFIVVVAVHSCFLCFIMSQYEIKCRLQPPC